LITIKEEFLASPKMRRAIELGGHESIVFWLFLKAYAAMNPADGFIPDEEIDRLGIGIVKAPRRKLEALVTCGKLQPDGSRGAGLVDVAPHGWQLHDYEDHANNQTDEEVRKVKARLKKQEQRRRKSEELERLKAQEEAGRVPLSSPGHSGDSHGDTDGDTTGDSPRDTNEGTLARAPAYARDPARSQPSPAQPSGGEKIPPPPAGRPRDPMGASFAGLRSDVVRVHEAWKRATGLTGHKLRGGAADLDATLLAESLDLHGEADCLLVAQACMRDRMVNGEADDRGEKHTSIRYIFGNEQTFARVLKLAREAARKSLSGNADDAFEAAMRAGA
jgi:hypothetical protein